MMKALLIGGTRGIGAATAQLLRARGWEVEATGRHAFDVHHPFAYRWWPIQFDALIFCAGDLLALGSFAFDFPLAFYNLACAEVVKPDGWIVAVSSVAAERPAKVNAHYAAAKAALESYARTLADSDQAKRNGWCVEVIRFDLVDTDMLKSLPLDTLTGRVIISAEAAGYRILTLMGVE